MDILSEYTTRLPTLFPSTGLILGDRMSQISTKEIIKKVEKESKWYDVYYVSPERSQFYTEEGT